MKPKTCLVTGGCGFIGSHMVKLLAQKNYEVVVLDNNSRSHKRNFPGTELYVGNVGDKSLLSEIFQRHKIDYVFHFAAYAYVSESVEKPSEYYDNNFIQTKVLLDEMREHRIPNIIFSSSCATYGEALYLPIDEKHPQNPISPYGRSKLMAEWLVKDYSRAYNLHYVIFRYFNVAGSDPEGVLGEDHEPETHLIPNILLGLLGKKKDFVIFGDDYPTPDGTCVRDFIHVEDLVSAHLLGVQYLEIQKRSDEFNLGVQRGFSIREVIEAVEQVTGKKVSFTIQPRRPGDPPTLWANSQKAQELLNWSPRYGDLKEMIFHAWEYFRKR